VRVPKLPWADLTRRPGWLTISALRTPLESLQNMSFLARRQQHLVFDASTELEIPRETGIAAGLAAFQNENYWYFLAVRRRAAPSVPGEASTRPQQAEGAPHAAHGWPWMDTLGLRGAGTAQRNAQHAPVLELFLEKRGGKQTETVARRALDEGVRVKLKIAANARAYSFYFDEDGSGWKPLRENDDGTILSTDVAGGFVGAFVGPYARAE
jgi:alpha-N-arabinofuranosidase